MDVTTIRTRVGNAVAKEDEGENLAAARREGIQIQNFMVRTS